MDEDEDFFFESDHLALRGNKDYKCMLRVILILESQKMMLVQDIENLAASQKAALENPQEFLDDLKNSAVDFPCSSYSIPELPAISWSKYGVNDNQVIEWKKSFVESDQEKANNNILVRGRTFDQTKPETFNQLWTCEEQRRLEELLKEYPEEEIEMRRWVKIANALGNRTPKQVMSRVQKYFIKLHQAGLPVPGRVRKPFTTKVGGLGYRNRYTKVFQKRSTFFPAQDVPVFMDENPQELENESSMEGNVIKQWTPLEMMTAIYERRRLEENSDTPLPVHTGISCIGCSCENIVGTRWTDGVGSDWCSDCLIEFQPITKLTPISSLNFKDEFTPS